MIDFAWSIIECKYTGSRLPLFGLIFNCQFIRFWQGVIMNKNLYETTQDSKSLQIVSSNSQFILQLKLGGPTVPTLLLNYSSPRLMGDGRRILQILLPPPSAELRIRRAVGARGKSSPCPQVLTGIEANLSPSISFALLLVPYNN